MHNTEVAASDYAPAGWPPGGFVAYLDARGTSTVTIEAALGWAQLAAAGRGSTVGPRRMTAARGFARYLAGTDAATEVPPLGLMPHRQRWRRPFIYAPADIGAVMNLARSSIVSPLRAATYDTLIGLLAASGLRIGEAIKLDRGDLDWDEGVLLIRESKFGKSRLVPLQASSMQALQDYARLRDDFQPRPADPSFFVSLNRNRLLYAVVSQTSTLPASAPVPRPLRGFTTCVTLSRSGPCSAGTAPVTTCKPRCPGCRPTSGIANPVPPTGTSRPPRNCSRWPPPARTPRGRRPGHDADRPDAAGVLHRPARPTATGQSRTIAAYRDTLRLLLGFVHRQTGAVPAQLDWADLDATTITAFLNHLESQRHNSSRTRNVRLTAIRSLFSYAALRHPEHALLIQRVLAIPPKRFDKRTVTFLTAPEVDALIAAPNQSRWEGRRDRVLMLLAIQTGLRVSELTGLNCGSITLGTGANVRCEGKGRKQRAVPLTNPVETLLRAWLDERAGHPSEPLFPTRTGRRLSRDAIALRVRTHGATAAQRCPSLLGKPIHPHVLRHSCAMSLLQAGVDTSVIAIWLGHAGVRSTDAYVHADISIKERALALTTPASAKPGRYRPPDKVLAFLESL